MVGIGNFDGVHRGHQRIIEAIKEEAGPRGTTGIITFRRHTRLPGVERERDLLTTIRQRLNYFQDEGISSCWTCDFNEEFADQSPGDFIIQTLVGRLRIAGVCVGAGFRFGKDRRGNVALLKELSMNYNFRVSEVPTVRVGGREVRSSVIREEIKNGNLEDAIKLLGHDYCLTGQIIRGRGRGKSLGYPTANFHPEQLLPAPGVYASRINAGFGERSGMVYIGTRPTFSHPGDRGVIAEAYIFDWSGNLEGKIIKVSLKKKLREDITFNHPGDLSVQIKKDEEETRRYFNNIKTKRS